MEKVANKQYENCAVFRGQGFTKHTSNISRSNEKMLWRVEYKTVTVWAPNLGTIYENRYTIAVDDANFQETSSNDIEAVVANLFVAKSVVELKVSLLDYKLPPKHLARK